MSARFGRNKRRRAREELAAEQKQGYHLRAALEQDRQLLAHRGRQLQAMQDYAIEIANIVGEASVIAGGPKELKGEFDRWRAIEYAHPMPIRYAETVSDFLDIPFRREVLRILNIEKVADQLSMMTHFVVTLSDKKAAYTLSDQAIWNMPADALENLLTTRIAPELARHLVAQLRRR